MLMFIEARVDVAVLEVGARRAGWMRSMPSSRDAAVITSVDLDHQN
jgi:folylpolyglutamate synthase/dihydropteroate synthase